jgi:hypothetical protein
MNIFALDKNPKIAVQYHADRHVVKMILETAQLLSTAHRFLDGTRMSVEGVTGKKKTRFVLPDERDAVLYRASFMKHPCAIWVRENAANYMWTLELFSNLLQEYTFRYNGNHHKSGRLLQTLDKLPNKIPIVSDDITPFAMAMPDEYRVTDYVNERNYQITNRIQSYRNYYKFGKKHLHSWRKRPVPWFIKEDKQYATKNQDVPNHPILRTALETSK